MDTLLTYLVGWKARGESVTGVTHWFCFTPFSVFTYRPRTPFVTCPAMHYAAFPHSSQGAGASPQHSKPSHTPHLCQRVGCLLPRGGNSNKQQFKNDDSWLKLSCGTRTRNNEAAQRFVFPSFISHIQALSCVASQTMHASQASWSNDNCWLP